MTEEKFQPWNRKHNTRYTFEELENFKGMTLGQMNPTDELHEFLTRYRLRQTKPEDYKFEHHECKAGFWATMKVWDWRQEAEYCGKPGKTKEVAEQNAMRAFLQDLDVIEAAKKLPPSIDKVRKYAFHKVKDANPDKTHEERRDLVYQAKQDYYREADCLTAFIDENF